MTDTVRFFDPDSSGGDGTTDAQSGGTAAYASCSSWDANEAATVTTGNRHLAYGGRTSATRDTTAVTVASPWSIADVGGMQIRTNDTNNDTSSGGATKTVHHGGVPDDGYIIQFSSGGVAGINMQVANFYVYGIEIEATNSGGYGFYNGTGVSGGRLDTCIAKCGTDTGRAAFQPYQFAMRNCLGWGGWAGIDSLNFAATVAENCTFAKCSSGIRAQASGGTAPLITNCVVAGSSTSDYVDGGIGWNGSSATNATDQSSGTGKPAITQTSISTSTEFEDYTNDDYSLPDGSTQLKANGTNLSGTFTDDITGAATRTSTFDIGAWKVAAAAGGGQPFQKRLGGVPWVRINRGIW